MKFIRTGPFLKSTIRYDEGLDKGSSLSTVSVKLTKLF